MPLSANLAKYPPAIFVTGTDTDAGKSYISAALIRHLAAQSLRVIGMKPVASGASFIQGEWVNADVAQLVAASNVAAPRALINPYCFAPAIAPHIAAQQAAVDIQFAPILEAFQQLCQLADVVIVEGAGGWLVPLNATQTIADLALALQIPVLLVVRIRLGCINHALLSAQAIQQSGLTLLGWVANCLDEDMPVMQENISTLKKMINAPCLAVVGKDQMPEFNLDI